ncbi:MAG: insulinase family protein [Neomegalonema sp.]|nr:insulinase family protein [Neomegalonema sp.]
MSRLSIPSSGISRLPGLALMAMACLLLLITPAAAQLAVKDLPAPKVTSFKLDNGMDIVVIEDHRAPVVTHMVWYRVGAADEPHGQSGIAHYLEHLMFKGTDDIAPGQFSKIIAAQGGVDNAFTSLDYTAYFQRIAADKLEMVMRMEADRMRDLRLTPKLAKPELAVVLEERSQRTDNSPEGQFYEQLSAALFMNHGYGVPVIGWRREIEKLDAKAALDFYKRFYAPDNAVLVVAGDVDPKDVLRLAKVHYGPLKAAGVKAFVRPQEPPHRAARRISMSDPKVRQPFVMRQYLVPSYVTAKPGEAEALSVATDILGGGFTARLSQRLVVQGKIALSAGAYYTGFTRDKTTLTVYVVPRPGVSLAEAEKRLDAVIAELIKEGPTEDELRRTKTSVIAASIYRLDSQASMARVYGAAITIGLKAEDIATWPARIDAVTAKDVQAALASLRIEASVTGWLSKTAVSPLGDAAKKAAEKKGAAK